jgi:hypothetical protein
MTTEPVDTVQDTVTGVLGKNPVPVTVTIVPGVPTVGLRMSVGVPGKCRPGSVVVVVGCPGPVVVVDGAVVVVFVGGVVVTDRGTVVCADGSARR